MKPWVEWVLVVVVEAALGAFSVAAGTKLAEHLAEKAAKAKPKKRKKKAKVVRRPKK